MHQRLLTVLGSVFLCSALCYADAKPRPSGPSSVVAIAYEFPDGGGAIWEGTGCPVEVRHKGLVIREKSKKGTYCCGFTFSVVMEAAKRRGLLDDMPVDNVVRFQREWYGAIDNAREKLVATALVNAGLGKEVTPKDAKPGDFIQFWRSKYGHSVIFLEWVTIDGKIVGLKYRSSQQATNGIGDHVDYFANSGIRNADVDPARFYVGRLNAGSDKGAS